jgi:hypothetical protein
MFVTTELSGTDRTGKGTATAVIPEPERASPAMDNDPGILLYYFIISKLSRGALIWVS